MRRNVLSTALILLFLGAGACETRPPLPVVASLPPWSLESSTGSEVSLDDLEGQVVIYDFIFTRCVASCPMMTARMGDLASKLRSDEVRFVSISVDPEWDTPDVLSEYREQVTTDDRWMFLTGDRDEIRELSVDGFMLAAEPPLESVDSGPIVHSSKFVLVDRSGAIRGYYDSLSPEAMQALAIDTRALLKE